MWPRELFKAEVAALLRLPNSIWPADAELLLEETFAGSTPKDDLQTVSWQDLPSGLVDLWAAATLENDESVRGFLQHLVNSADVLTERSVPRPYRSARHAPAASTTELRDRAQQLQRDWARLVEDLRDRGYFERVAPHGCVEHPAPPADEVLDAEIEQRLGVAGLWPLHPGDWAPETFYSIIEVVHDLVARPRHRLLHPPCGWDYSGFALEPARVLHRWHVDRLLARYGVNLQLAAEGEDAGRLVRTAGDDRDDLGAWVRNTCGGVLR